MFSQSQIIKEQFRDLDTLHDLELLEKDLGWGLDMTHIDLNVIFSKAESVLDSVGDIDLPCETQEKLQQITSHLFTKCGTPSAARELVCLLLLSCALLDGY